MFEKEAEEIARKLEESQTLGVYDNDEDLTRDIAWDEGKVAGYEEGFKDGAEFGYNKAMNEIGNRMESAYREGVAFGKDKANEWHEIESKVTPKREISKQYMPKSKEKVLLKYHFSGDDEIHISDGYYDAYDFEFHIANNPKFRIVCVIAWKEIVLPELSKEIKEKCELCEDDPKWELAEKYHSYIAYKKDGTI